MAARSSKAAAVEAPQQERDGVDEPVPWEFTPEAVEASREGAYEPYKAEMKENNSLPATFMQNNPWLATPAPGTDLVFGEFYEEGSEFEGYPKKYYDTLPMDEHPYYKDLDYPKPTKDIQRLRHDLYDWGFCLIEDAMTPEQTERFRSRVEAQAAGERASGTAYTSGSFQIVWSLINKGRVFEQIMNHDPAAVQAGPMIERLITETIGGGWSNLNGGAANIAFPGCHPQGLHQDQAASGWTTPNAPTMLNSMFVLQDVDHINGGTLFIPGSHKIIEEAVRTGKPLGKLPPSCNLKAKAGTVMLFEGRVLHGTGANRSDQWRYVVTIANVKPWLRQQENTMLGLRPEVLDRATEKLMQRLVRANRNGFVGPLSVLNCRKTITLTRQARDKHKDIHSKKKTAAV
jgi:ectoine hydroxylase-related dioxygenase (phytanoyl-CoA dioxygenase family)